MSDPVDLQQGCRIELLRSALALSSSSAVATKCNRDETKCDRGEIVVLRDYAPERDAHLVEHCDDDGGLERKARWLCLSSIPFRIATEQPMAQMTASQFKSKE